MTDYRFSRFRDAMDFVFRSEGGYTNNENDAGGETNLGVTIGTLRRAHHLGIVGHEVPKMLTRKEALDIYFELYWKPCHAYELAPPLDYIIFDIAVNCGVGRAVMILQQALNTILVEHLKVDGKFGDRTRTAVDRIVACRMDGIVPLGLILSSLCILERVEFYDQITDGVGSTARQRQQEVKNRQFLRGWIRRTMDLYNSSMVASHG